LARKKRGAKRGGGRRGKYNSGPSFDVKGLRERIGKAHGVKQCSRDTLAKLIGAAVGSIVNWEKGMVPRGVYLEKLNEVEHQLAAGQLHLDLPRRGRKPKTPRPTARPIPTISVSPVRGLPHEPANQAPLLYANHVRVDQANGEARVRFTLVMPGTRDVRAIADVIVPTGALSGFKG
jgi:DNA-binding XRE family transcriptional regulator